MGLTDLVESLADAWRKLQPEHAMRPEECAELARKTTECLALLAGERGRADSHAADLLLARTIRRCERLARAIQAGAAMVELRGSSPPPSSAMETSGAIVVRAEPGLGAVVELQGYVTRPQLERALCELDAALLATGGALLIDARASAGHARDCGTALAEWVGARASLRVTRVGVAVQGGLQFARATRALAVATGIGWRIGQDRDEIARWLVTADAATN